MTPDDAAPAHWSRREREDRCCRCHRADISMWVMVGDGTLRSCERCLNDEERADLGLGPRLRVIDGGRR